MISPRMEPHNLVLGGKLYVLGGDLYSNAFHSRGGEVFDPITGSWEALPDAPCPMEFHIISAALENPNRILVASPGQEQGRYTLATFFTYDVQNCSWKLLEPALAFARCTLNVLWDGEERLLR
jgi:hypothetical protein